MGELADPPFTIVTAFKGARRELQYVTRSVTSMIRLQPKEIIFAMDENPPSEAVKLIHDTCNAAGFTRYMIIGYPVRAGWRLQLANTVFHAYMDARTDRILCCDIDTRLTKAVLIGRNIVGDKVALCSFTKRYPVNGPGRLLRYIMYRINVRRRKWTFSGVYWIWKRSYFMNVDEHRIARIRNGIDTFLVHSIKDKGWHDIVTRKEIGAVSMDRSSEDYDWAQFKLGLWYGARKKGLRYCLAVGLLYWHPGVIRGWLWARRNPERSESRYARDYSLTDWLCAGADPVKRVKTWKDTGRTGYGEKVEKVPA